MLSSTSYSWLHSGHVTFIFRSFLFLEWKMHKKRCISDCVASHSLPQHTPWTQEQKRTVYRNTAKNFGSSWCIGLLFCKGGSFEMQAWILCVVDHYFNLRWNNRCFFPFSAAFFSVDIARHSQIFSGDSEPFIYYNSIDSELFNIICKYPSLKSFLHIRKDAVERS